MLEAFRDAHSKRQLHITRLWNYRFLTHKVACFKRVMVFDRFGTYLVHIVAMAEGTSLKPVDQLTEIDS